MISVPSTNNGYTINLRHLAIETCRRVNLHIFWGRQPLVDKIYYMIGAGAEVRLMESRSDGYTLHITGVRVILEDDKPIYSSDPNSIASIRIIDCGYKICCSVVIGNYNFSSHWDGHFSGDTTLSEAIGVFQDHLIELAQNIGHVYQLRLASTLAASRHSDNNAVVDLIFD